MRAGAAKLLWFAALWMAGVAATGAVVAALHVMLMP